MTGRHFKLMVKSFSGQFVCASNFRFTSDCVTFHLQSVCIKFRPAYHVSVAGAAVVYSIFTTGVGLCIDTHGVQRNSSPCSSLFGVNLMRVVWCAVTSLSDKHGKEFLWTPCASNLNPTLVLQLHRQQQRLQLSHDMRGDTQSIWMLL